MERMFGVLVYVVGLLMMITMVLNAIGVINRTGPIPTLAFLVFGYLLCVTGYLFTRRSPRIR